VQPYKGTITYWNWHHQYGIVSLEQALQGHPIVFVTNDNRRSYCDGEFGTEVVKGAPGREGKKVYISHHIRQVKGKSYPKALAWCLEQDAQ